MAKSNALLTIMDHTTMEATPQKVRLSAKEYDLVFTRLAKCKHAWRLAQEHGVWYAYPDAERQDIMTYSKVVDPLLEQMYRFMKKHYERIPEPNNLIIS